MSDILKACKGMAESTFKPGEDLIQEGARPGRIYILESGEVKISRKGVEMARTRLKGSLLGEMGALLGINASATVTASSPVSAYRVDNGDQFLRDNPEFAIHAATMLAHRLNAAQGYLSEAIAERKEAGRELDEAREALSLLITNPEGEA